MPLMQISADEIRQIERLHVRAWPAFETADIHGWLWRYSGGGSQRANSVSTVHFTGDDPAAAVDEAEARYRARDAIVRFHTYDLSAPAGITNLLEARGYRGGETTLTMVKAVTAAKAPDDVEVAAAANAEWQEVYLGAISESRRSVNAKILGSVPQPRGFFFLPARRTGDIERAMRCRRRFRCYRMHGDARRGAAAGRRGRGASQP